MAAGDVLEDFWGCRGSADVSTRTHKGVILSSLSTLCKCHNRHCARSGCLITCLAGNLKDYFLFSLTVSS